jgi:hypothetical protein
MTATGLAVAGAVPPPQASGYKLVFDDEFDSLDLSPDGGGEHTWYEGVWFNRLHASLSDISAASSVLTLSWKRGMAAPDTSIETLSRDGHNFHAWQYGYFEARMRWDVAKGAWPAFWLIPVEDATGLSIHNGRRESGEIDIFEGSGDNPHDYFGTVQRWVDGKRAAANRENRYPVPNSVDYSRFHIYGLLWVPGAVTWYLDNRPLHSEKTYDILDKQHYFLIFSMQEGIDWKPGAIEGLAKDTLALNVDWVRVWQK